MSMLRHRKIEPELLDGLDPEQGRINLRDLERLNRNWGGRPPLRWLLRDVAGDFSVLDVGAASGDMGATLRELRPGARVTSLDFIPWHLERAQPPRVAADAFALPFRDAAFDYVFCSLFLHHFENEAVVTLLQEFRRVARRSVWVSDLERHPVSYYFVPWTRRIFGWDRVTCHDAPISVAAGFTAAELRELAVQAGLTEVSTNTFRPGFRIALRGRCEASL